MRHLLPTLSLGTTCVALLACPPRSPARTEPAAPPPPPIQVPAGCEALQSGTYHHAEDPGFRYLGMDDGGTLSLTVVRTRESASAAEVPDAGTPSIFLQRTPAGFVGETRATVLGPAGSPCEVGFPTEVQACDDAGLTLRAVTSTPIDEACRPLPAADGGGTWREQRLVREQPAPSP